jgi:multidrug efflux system outer membrane protein
MRRKILYLGTLSALLVAGSCAVGPKYQRPEIPVPQAYRGATTDAPTAESLGDTQWWTLFQDQELQALIRKAVAQNLDVQIAAARVSQAQAQAGIARGDQFPTLGATGAAGRQKSPSNPFFPGFETNTSQLGLSAVWQLDFWGKYRKASEAARASLAASDWGRKAVIATLVSNVASAYFSLRALDFELEIARRTLKARQESLRLNKTMEENGAISQLEVQQAAKLVEMASRRVPDLEKRIAQQENLISVLLGENPGSVPRGQPLLSQTVTMSVPEGLPSTLLERRPDVRQAELRLVAANARIGVAKAAFFPQISLTGNAGFQAYSLGGLFDSKVFNVGPSMTTPIFDLGTIRSGVRLSEAQKQEMLLSYRQAVVQAFREVSDALVAVEKNREYRERQKALTEAADQAAKLSDLRFKGGASSYLEVLTSENDLFDAEIELAQAHLNERLAVVQLYNALGGGWKQQ